MKDKELPQQFIGPLASTYYRLGRLAGRMEAFDSTLRQEAALKTLTADVLRTSEIEGQLLDAGQVRSALAQRLKMDIGPLKPAGPAGRPHR
jgi:Fic family protein